MGGEPLPTPRGLLLEGWGLDVDSDFTGKHLGFVGKKQNPINEETEVREKAGEGANPTGWDLGDVE